MGEIEDIQHREAEAGPICGTLYSFRKRLKVKTSGQRRDTNNTVLRHTDVRIYQRDARKMARGGVQQGQLFHFEAS